MTEEELAGIYETQEIPPTEALEGGPAPRSCRYCKYCDRRKGYKCRYNPPTMMGWPTVQYHDYCRLFELDAEFLSLCEEQKKRDIAKKMAANANSNWVNP